MFENLQDRLGKVLRKIQGQAKISESNIQEAMQEVRVALLEADVNIKAARDFISRVEERAVGAEVLESISPGQQVIKIVHDEMVRLIGGEEPVGDLELEKRDVIMLLGLQGSGKTTTAAKLANHLRKKGRSPLLVAADVYRPAAIRQLEVLGEQNNLPVFSMGQDKPLKIATKAMAFAEENHHDIIILDTAGRLHIDQDMLDELIGIKKKIKPRYSILVLDSMTGQDAVTQTSNFNEQVGIDGVVLTKLDGDARGGAALSIRAVTNVPIYYAGVGEKIDEFERFHPDRMASRILGMGDVLTLVEKAQEVFDEEKALEMQKKFEDQSFTFEDFQEQLKAMKSMGPIGKVMDMIPGMSQMKGNQEVDDSELVRIESIINSMTLEEKQNPKSIGGSRRRRIANGSGTSFQSVNQLMKQFEMMRQMMHQMSTGKGKLASLLGGMGGGGNIDPSMLPGKMPKMPKIRPTLGGMFKNKKKDKKKMKAISRKKNRGKK